MVVVFEYPELRHLCRPFNLMWLSCSGWPKRNLHLRSSSSLLEKNSVSSPSLKRTLCSFVRSAIRSEPQAGISVVRVVCKSKFIFRRKHSDILKAESALLYSSLL